MYKYDLRIYNEISYLKGKMYKNSYHNYITGEVDECTVYPQIIYDVIMMEEIDVTGYSQKTIMLLSNYCNQRLPLISAVKCINLFSS